MNRRVMAAALIVLLSLAGACAALVWLRSDASEAAAASPAEPESTADLDLVELSTAKTAAAGFQTAPAARRVLQPVCRVPGRIKYDESNHVAVRAPAAGVLTEVLVKPGDRVQPGQTLAKLSSRDIGEARADVLRREEELRLAQMAQQRDEEIWTNLQVLAPLLEERVPVAEIESRFSGKALGAYRETLLSAYSELRLTEEVFTAAQSVSGGALAGNVHRERRRNFEVAQAGFQAATETALFACRRQRDEAALAVEDAQRRLDVSRQRLRMLAGGADSPKEVAADDLSTLEIVAWTAGMVEQRFFARTEQVEASDTLFILADPSHLWVAADVREREWEALRLAPGDEVIVEPAGMPDERISATLLYVGREMSPDSHAVPLVASFRNANELLRPGMYATVSLPLGPSREGLAVPPGAVMRHEGDTFVFVAQGPQTFRRVAVETGLETENWIEIRQGLKAGDPVVQRGAFLLKSELLLERESE